ncbi:MAG TPA: hypothetical protein VMZ53_25780 [Kofleriaceae bacterium]|nr:hypothetical protein [Kofleriaceae bacterium]
MRHAASTGCLVGLLCIAACHDCPEKPDDCVENDVTLTQGVYGQVVEGDDVVHDGSCREYAQPVSYPVWFETTDGVRVAEDVADEHGAYELAMTSGEYRACVQDNNNNRRCGALRTVTVPTTGRVRYDIWTGVIGLTTAAVRGPSLCGREP